MRVLPSPEYPILRRLVRTQLGTVLFAVVLILSVVGVIAFVSYRAEMSRLRTRAETALASQQQKWRAWKALELNGPLIDELESTKSQLNLASLEITSDGGLNSDGCVITLPVPGDETANSSRWRVVARLTPPIEAVLKETVVPISIIAVLALLFVALIVFSTKYLRQLIVCPFEDLLAEFDRVGRGDTFRGETIRAEGEMRRFVDEIERMYGRVKESEKEKAIGRMAAQVSHDLRSPLSTLLVIADKWEGLKPEQRSLLHQVAERILELSSSLLQQYADSRLEVLSSHDSVQPIDRIRPSSIGCEAIEPSLHDFLTLLLEQKRVEFEKFDGLQLVNRVSVDNCKLGANIDRRDFSRVISNIVNNAVEALPDGRGEVVIEAESSPIRFRLSVRDNGKGMPSHVLNELGNPGVTHGKARGLGLGLSHAYRCADAWRGMIKVFSQEGKGTLVELIIPN